MHYPYPAAHTILLTVPAKPWVFVLVKTQAFRWPLGLDATLSAQEGQG